MRRTMYQDQMAPLVINVIMLVIWCIYCDFKYKLNSMIIGGSREKKKFMSRTRGFEKLKKNFQNVEGPQYLKDI